MGALANFRSKASVGEDLRAATDGLASDVDAVAAASVAGVATGYKLARGTAALDGTNPTPVATGLATIVSAVVQLRGASTPGDGTSVLTTDYTGSDGTLNVYGWKNTSGTDPTLVASTGTDSFDWVAIGT